MIRILTAVLFLSLLSACQTPEQEATEADLDHSHEDGGHTHDVDMAPVVTDTLDAEVIQATDVSPEYIRFATGIDIIPDIRDAISSVGVETHEGTFGPLLFADRTRSFFIDLKQGMFLSEHPHPTESIVYTVSGKWVLCSEGKRQVMEAGTLFTFGDNIPTGWEAPFEGGAHLLIVKGRDPGSDYASYVQGLEEMDANLDSQYEDGFEFYFNQLPDDHPAITFARSVNPNFDAVLAALE